MLNFSKQRLLIVAPHPDDEVLGCAGLIQKVKEQGGKVYVLFLTVGITSDLSKKGISTSRERIKEIKKVAKFLDYDSWRIAFVGNQYHLKLHTVPISDIIYQIEGHEDISIKTIQPTIVATTQMHDYNQDHRTCFEAVMAATRPAPHTLKPLINFILGYEFAGSAGWGILPSYRPNFFLQLTKVELQTKIKAMNLYLSQKRTRTHSRSSDSISALAHFRGIHCSVTASEAYYIYRLFSR